MFFRTQTLNKEICSRYFMRFEALHLLSTIEMIKLVRELNAKNLELMYYSLNNRSNTDIFDFFMVSKGIQVVKKVAENNTDLVHGLCEFFSFQNTKSRRENVVEVLNVITVLNVIKS